MMACSNAEQIKEQEEEQGERHNKYQISKYCRK